MKLEHIFLSLGVGLVIYYIISSLKEHNEEAKRAEAAFEKYEERQKTGDLPLSPEWSITKLKPDETEPEERYYDPFLKIWAKERGFERPVDDSPRHYYFPSTLKRSYSPSEIRAKILGQLTPTFAIKAGHFICKKIQTANNKAEVVRLTKIGFEETFGVAPKYDDNSWYVLAYSLWAIYSAELESRYSIANASDVYMYYFTKFANGEISPLLSSINDTNFFTGKWVPKPIKTPVEMPRVVKEKKYLPLPYDPRHLRAL